MRHLVCSLAHSDAGLTTTGALLVASSGTQWHVAHQLGFSPGVSYEEQPDQLLDMTRGTER